MTKKNNNGLKGLLLILVIVTAVLAIFLIEINQKNMRVLITTYSNNKPLINARVSLDGKTLVSDDQGKVFFKLRVSENDKLIIIAEADGFKSKSDTILIDDNRFKSKNISKYIIFDN